MATYFAKNTAQPRMTNEKATVPTNATKKQDEWSAAVWLSSLKEVPRVLAVSLLAASPAADDELDALQNFGRELTVAALAEQLQSAGCIESLAACLLPALQDLATDAGDGSTDSISSKFAGQVQMQMHGLDAFFGGLEGLVGAPRNNVLDAMVGDHTKRADSKLPFTTGNYGITTTSDIEWRFVYEPEESQAEQGPGAAGEEGSHAGGAEVASSAWPAESEARLPNRAHCRKPRALSEFREAMDEKNAQLQAVKQPPMTTEELIGARLYTGPLFEKYNAVLRGVNSTVPFLRSQLVTRCASVAAREAYSAANTPVDQTTPSTEARAAFNAHCEEGGCLRPQTLPSALQDLGIVLTEVEAREMISRYDSDRDGSLGLLEFARLASVEVAWATARAGCNRYTTTLHCINSAIVRLGKLTVASSVYRGIGGMALPEAFWTPNEFGVMGGVESAFMSTTLNKAVAVGYASGGEVGLVFEIRQGMVDRGADISWLSQYEHEREILFGPLTGLEVLGTRIEGSVVILEARLSVNMNALTFEQVVGKRKKLMTEMCDVVLAELEDLARTHPGVRCRETGMDPIQGDLYLLKGSIWGDAICADYYHGLPATGDDHHAKEAYEGPVVPPVSAADVNARVELAARVLRSHACGDSADFYNDDENFAAATALPLMVKRAFFRVGLPPMMQLLGCTSLELPDDVELLEAVQAVKSDVVSGRLEVKRLMGGCDDLRLLADPEVALISNLSSRTSLPPSIGVIQSLEVIDLDGAGELAELPSLDGLVMTSDEKWDPDEPDAKLTTLNLDGCRSLVALPAVLSRFGALRLLQLDDCYALTELPDLSSLMVQRGSVPALEVRNLPAHCAPWAAGGFKAWSFIANGWPASTTTELNLSGLRLDDFPAWLSSLTVLTELTIDSCARMRSLPDLSRLTKLTALDISGSIRLPAAPPELSTLLLLETISFSNCKRFTTLPDLSRLLLLRDLNLNNCLRLTCLPRCLADLPKLASVSLYQCDQLGGELPNLSSLIAREGGEVREVPEHLCEWEAGGFSRWVAPPPLKEGDAVEIIRGAYTGKLGVVIPKEKGEKEEEEEEEEELGLLVSFDAYGTMGDGLCQFDRKYLKRVAASS
jgi:hypothetical protein